MSLGAINKLTGQYTYPKIAKKTDKYICIECHNDLTLAQGEIRVHYFRHRVDDSKNPCLYYNKPTESQVHKDAKMLLKHLLETKTPIQFKRLCVCCNNNIDLDLPEITETSIVELEYRFKHNEHQRIADVAHTLDGSTKCIYEICHTHKTSSENRPEPWVEIDANSLISIANANNEELIINCIRRERCQECENIPPNKHNQITMSERTTTQPDLSAAEIHKRDLKLLGQRVLQSLYYNEKQVSVQYE